VRVHEDGGHPGFDQLLARPVEVTWSRRRFARAHRLTRCLVAPDPRRAFDRLGASGRVPFATPQQGWKATATGGTPANLGQTRWWSRHKPESRRLTKHSKTQVPLLRLRTARRPRTNRYRLSGTLQDPAGLVRVATSSDVLAAEHLGESPATPSPPLDPLDPGHGAGPRPVCSRAESGHRRASHLRRVIRRPVVPPQRPPAARPHPRRLPPTPASISSKTIGPRSPPGRVRLSATTSPHPRYLSPLPPRGPRRGSFAVLAPLNWVAYSLSPSLRLRVGGPLRPSGSVSITTSLYVASHPLHVCSAAARHALPAHPLDLHAVASFCRSGSLSHLHVVPFPVRSSWPSVS